MKVVVTGASGKLPGPRMTRSLLVTSVVSESIGAEPALPVLENRDVPARVGQ